MNRCSGPVFSLLVTLALCLAPGTGSAQQIFGTALLTEHEPPADAYWTIEDHNTPYPNQLAKDEVSGCLVAEVDVSASGKTKLVDIQQSFPRSGLERAFKRSINRIRWVPVDDTEPEREERRQIRIDFCISFESMESARLQCVQSALQACQ
jgi:hypothetical protein